MFKNWIRGLLYAVKLVVGLLIYFISKKTPAFAYQAMVGLFCLTKGYSNDVLSKVIGYINRPYHFSQPNGLLGDMTDERRNKILSKLRDDGYYIFEDRLQKELCDNLLNYATSNVCEMRPMDGNVSGKPVFSIYHRGDPQAVRYDFNTQDLIDNSDVQNIFADMSFAVVAQDYLRARPIIDVVGMWWHTNFSNKPDKEAAQYYHFDMDRPKWLKFFIYLTDVETTNGPHTFVAGSHKTGGIPSSLLKKGYARLTDDEVSHLFDEKNIIEFNAPSGTIIAEDTRGLHKGKYLNEGDRLVLQIQFSNSLFGGYYAKTRMSKCLTRAINASIKKFPNMYKRYL